VRLAWLSPLPPTPSGIADYSAELVPLIAERSTVDVVCPPHRGRAEIDGASVLSPESFSPDGYDAVFHHLGNNPFHDFVYRHAREHPGVAVFHDVVLHHLIDWLSFAQGRRDSRGYANALESEYGEVGRRLVDLRSRGVVTELERFLFPLSGHVAREARAIVVHSHGVRDRMIEVAPGAEIFVIPHHAQPAPRTVAGVTRREARERLGLPADAFVVGHFGFITKPKQPGPMLRGFARLAERRDALLLLVGENQTAGRALDRFTRRLGIQDRVRLTGYVDLPQFYLYLKSADVVVNLRYPTAGETSGTFARALAEGKATIVNNLGSFAEVPDDVALKVEVDEDQAEALGRHLVRVSEDPNLRRSLGNHAQAYAATELDPRRCAEMYLEVARSISNPA
jgi:glycosyltransferase involved in cell wall biosynthesis